jgi:hypothetical protein
MSVGLGMGVGQRYRNEVFRTVCQLVTEYDELVSYGNEITDGRAVAVLSVMAEVQSPLRESHRIKLLSAQHLSALSRILTPPSNSLTPLSC